MPTLTQQQMDAAEYELTNNGVAAFYDYLASQGDDYSYLGAAVTRNGTWQGELANKYAEQAAKDDAVDLSYGSPDWIALNSDVAERYLQTYRDNSGATPDRQDVQDIHHAAYGQAGLDENDWFPNKLLTDSGNPDALWADFVVNEGAGDLIGDAWTLAKDNLLALTVPPLFAAAAATDFAGLVAKATFAANLLEALKDLSGGAKSDMATAFTGTDIEDLLDMLADLPDGIGGFLARIPDLLDDASPWLEKVLPDWFDGPRESWGQAPALNSPLVLDLDGDGVELTTFNSSTTTTFFDLYGDGFVRQTAWVGADDGLLAIDTNENGKIDDITELFGSATVDGFALLSELDSNGDSIINQYDDAWTDLVVWKDVNGDGVSEGSELLTLSSLNIVSFDLAGVASSSSTINGNPISHTSTYKLANGTTRTVADAWFVHDAANSAHAGDYTLDLRSLFLPTLRGFGTLPDLHIAMSEDATLLGLVEDLALEGWDFETFQDAETLDDAVAEILYRWAGVEEVNPTSRGLHVDAQHLEFLEAFYSEPFEHSATWATTRAPWRARPLRVRGTLCLEASKRSC